MALSKETIGWIAELSGLSAEDITAKINSEKEEEIKKPQGEFFTEEDLTKRDSSKYKEGKDAGSEMLIKDLKKKYGYDFEGKDAESFMAHHENELKKKYSKDSNARVEELENDLKKQKETFEDEIKGYKSQLEDLSGKYRGETIRNTLLSIMPKNTTIKPDAIVTLFKNDYEIAEEDGKMVVKKNGETLKDTKTASPLDVKDVFNEYVVKEGFAKGEPGRGGGNEFGEKGYTSKTPVDFQNEWQQKNPDKTPNSPEFQKDYQEWRKASQSA